MNKLSVAIATYNEEENLGRCLESIRQLADEIVVVDGSSTDKTVEVAKKFGARVFITDNPLIFHINKQKAIDACTGSWILQLDADERVTPKLAKEIKKVIWMKDEEQEDHQQNLPKRKLFLRHQKLLEERDGKVGTDDASYAAFFIPRLNFFLGKFLRWGGVYPDGVIRLIRKGKARFPCQSVHEQMVVEGRVGWLGEDLVHLADPTFKRYLERHRRYIDLIAEELKNQKVAKTPLQFFNYFFIKPVWWFFLTQFRHKGFLDGYQGVIFSFFSSLRFPRAYWRYLAKGGQGK